MIIYMLSDYACICQALVIVCVHRWYLQVRNGTI
jgi:hypothetical protein